MIENCPTTMSPRLPAKSSKTTSNNNNNNNILLLRSTANGFDGSSSLSSLTSRASTSTRRSLIADSERVEDTLSHLRSLRKSTRMARRSVEDDRDEARIIVQQAKDIRHQIRKQLQAHYPFSTLENEIFNNSASCSSLGDQSQSNIDEDYNQYA